MALGSIANAAKLRVLGIAFLALLLGGVYLTYAIFTKKFVPYDEVTLLSSKTGLQLPSRADVKIRGVLVGEVLDATATAQGAKITLGIYPDQADTVPADVSAKIVPKTLFGEKYVLLEPHGDLKPTIQAGDTIRQSKVSIEVEKLLNDFYPFLRTVDPADLNYTLTALSNALEGRGEEIGKNLETFDSYLKRMNPQLPQAIEDLKKLGSTADLYDSVLDDVATTLRNTVRTGQTFVTKDQKVRALFSDVAAFSDTTRGFLKANGDNIVALGKVSATQLRVFAKYSPEYPCLFQGIVKVAPRQAEAFRGYTLHINLEPLRRQPRGFEPSETPVFGDKRGPIDTGLCRSAVNDKFGQNNLPPQSLVPDFVDGVRDSTIGKRSAPGFAVTSGYAGTRHEVDSLRPLLASVLGESTEDTPDVAGLLFGPIARGTKVTLR